MLDIESHNSVGRCGLDEPSNVALFTDFPDRSLCRVQHVWNIDVFCVERASTNECDKAETENKDFMDHGGCW